MPVSDERESVSIGPYEPGDEKEILRLFRKVFNEDRSPDVWNWEFRDCPEGIHSFVGKTPSGRIVSQFCGIPVRMKVGDRSLVFSQIVDSMVDPEFRSGLKKPGLFATTVYRFVDHFGHADREAVMYGLPNPQAFRIGQRLLGYSHIRDIRVAVRAVTPDIARPMPPEEIVVAGGPIFVRVVSDFPADVDGLWERLAPRYDVICRRDRRFLSWRYTACPRWRYVPLEARDRSGRLVGYSVLRTSWLGQPDLMVADWFVDSGAPAAGVALLRTIEALASKAGMESVKILVPEPSASWDFLMGEGYAAALTPFVLVARTYDRDGLPLSRLASGWYYTMGDFDVV